MQKKIAGVLEQSDNKFSEQFFNLTSAEIESYLMVLTKQSLSLETFPFALVALTYSRTQLRCSKSLGFSPLKCPV